MIKRYWSENGRSITINIKKIGMLVFEAGVVYFCSNLPFLFAALDIENGASLYQRYVQVLTEEVNSGELLVLVCALIAPVLYWSMVESKKVIQKGALSLVSLIMILLATYIYGRGAPFPTIDSFNIYIAALFAWAAYLFCREFPPERKDYAEIDSDYQKSFLAATRRQDI